MTRRILTDAQAVAQLRPLIGKVARVALDQGFTAPQLLTAFAEVLGTVIATEFLGDDALELAMSTIADHVRLSTGTIAAGILQAATPGGHA